jgi:hypothetical protein
MMIRVLARGWWRFALAVLIVAAHTMTWTEKTQAKESCKKCQLLAGGATGSYADCSASGSTIGTCLYTTITHCYGYPCGSFAGEEEFGPEDDGH